MDSIDDRLQRIVERMFPFSPCGCDDDIILDLRKHRKSKLLRKLEGLTEDQKLLYVEQWEQNEQSAKN